MPLQKPISYTTEYIYSLPEGKRAELIDGTIYDMSPPNRIHQKILLGLSSAIYHYIKQKKGSCEVYPAPFAVFLNNDNNTYVEPDISVICDQTKLDNYGCHGAPDWIIEIVSPSTKRIDYGTKLFQYYNAGVREYWIINPLTSIVNVYDFEHEKLTDQYDFHTKIPVCIYEDFQITISEFL